MYAAFAICTHIHIRQYALIFCCYRRPNFTPSASLAPLKCVESEREMFRFSLIIFSFTIIMITFYAFSSGSDWVLEADWSTWTSILSLCLLFSIWSSSMSSRSFWTLSKYESIKCQVPFRLLFNVNGINIFWKCCTNNFNQIC